MLGFSFSELIVVLIVALILIKPKDLPEIAHFCGKIYYRAKNYFHDLKAHFNQAQKDLGIDNIRQELERGFAEEKAKFSELKNDMTVIIDIYGKEHKVPAINQIRPDLNEEDLQSEIEKFNQINIKNKST
jgi:Sec-independent protein translocase protein TatA